MINMSHVGRSDGFDHCKDGDPFDQFGGVSNNLMELNGVPRGSGRPGDPDRLESYKSSSGGPRSPGNTIPKLLTSRTSSGPPFLRAH